MDDRFLKPGLVGDGRGVAATKIFSGIDWAGIETVQLASFMGIHSCNLAIQILMEKFEKAGD